MGLILIALFIYMTFFFSSKRKLLVVEEQLNELNNTIISNIDEMIELAEFTADSNKMEGLDQAIAELKRDRSKIKRSKPRYFTQLEADLYGLLITIESGFANILDSNNERQQFSEKQAQLKFNINSSKDEYNPLVDDYYSMMAAQMIVSMLRGQKHFDHWIKIEPTSKRYF